MKEHDYKERLVKLRKKGDRESNERERERDKEGKRKKIEVKKNLNILP